MKVVICYARGAESKTGKTKAMRRLTWFSQWSRCCARQAKARETDRQQTKKTWRSTCRRGLQVYKYQSKSKWQKAVSMCWYSTGELSFDHGGNDEQGILRFITWLLQHPMTVMTLRKVWGATSRGYTHYTSAVCLHSIHQQVVFFSRSVLTTVAKWIPCCKN